MTENTLPSWVDEITPLAPADYAPPLTEAQLAAFELWAEEQEHLSEIEFNRRYPGVL